MSALTIPPNTALSPAMQKYLAERGGLPSSELGAGITAGFAVVGYRGKTWSIKHRGEEQMLMRHDEPDTPVSRLEVVIVKASPFISKIFYLDGWVEGSSAPPDCWSVDGVKPDDASPKKQCTTCAGCPMNQWGSHITPAGKKSKRCTDSKRLAVVPRSDIDNSRYGGAMLLRVPAASLGDMAAYDNGLTSKGFPYFGVATALSFDPSESFPKFIFKAIAPLQDDADVLKVLEMRDSDQVNRILSAPVEQVTADVASPNAVDGSLSQRAAARDPAVVEAERQASVRAAQEAAQAAAKKLAEEKAAAAKKAAEEAEKAAAALAAQANASFEFEEAGPATKPATVAQGAGVAAAATVAATPVANANEPPPVAAAAASDVVDAEVLSEQNSAGTPAEFDSLLDEMLKA